MINSNLSSAYDQYSTPIIYQQAAYNSAPATGYSNNYSNTAATNYYSAPSYTNTTYPASKGHAAIAERSFHFQTDGLIVESDTSYSAIVDLSDNKIDYIVHKVGGAFTESAMVESDIVDLTRKQHLPTQNAYMVVKNNHAWPEEKKIIIQKCEYTGEGNKYKLFFTLTSADQAELVAQRQRENRVTDNYMQQLQQVQTGAPNMSETEVEKLLQTRLLAQRSAQEQEILKYSLPTIDTTYTKQINPTLQTDTNIQKSALQDDTENYKKKLATKSLATESEIDDEDTDYGDETDDEDTDYSINNNTYEADTNNYKEDTKINDYKEDTKAKNVSNELDDEDDDDDDTLDD